MFCKPAHIAGLVATAALLVFPASSLGAAPFGSDLEREPNADPGGNTSQCDQATSPCTRIAIAFPENDEGEPTTAPIDGVVTQFKIRANSPDQVTFRLARVLDMDQALVQAAGTGPTVTLQGTGAVETYPARVPVKAGDYLALDSATTTAQYGNSGGKRQLKFGPVLADGQGPRSANDIEDEFLTMAAVVEPDADKDGFGDETQDGCPTNPAAQGACPNPDVTTPTFANTAMAGSQIFFRLSEPAKVSFKVSRVLPGRKASNGKCARVTKKNIKRRKCSRYVSVKGSFSRNAVQGLNVVKFNGRIGGKKLVPGRYRMTIVATDASGNKSKASNLFFTIKKSKRK